jgi:hypothetical protein
MGKKHWPLTCVITQAVQMAAVISPPATTAPPAAYPKWMGDPALLRASSSSRIAKP